MSIIIKLAEPRGFCTGVERALQIVERALKDGPFPVYVLHEIVHNDTVVNALRERGVIFIDDVSEAKSGTLVFSAHGVGRSIEEQASRQPVRIVDATCPIVKNLHRKMMQYSLSGREIILFGRNGHREVEGLLGRVETPVYVIESEDHLESFLKNADRRKKYACLSQTTQNAEEIVRMRERLLAVLPDVEVSADVCFATRDRQNAVRQLAAECPVVLVVGSVKSSNTRRLQEIAEQCGAKAYLLQDAESFDPSWLKGVKEVAITSGASAPEKIVQDICHKLCHDH